MPNFPTRRLKHHIVRIELLARAHFGIIYAITTPLIIITFFKNILTNPLGHKMFHVPGTN